MERERLRRIVEAGRVILHEAHEVTYLMTQARRACGGRVTAEAQLIEALALHQLLVSRVSHLLREAEEVLDVKRVNAH